MSLDAQSAMTKSNKRVSTPREAHCSTSIDRFENLGRDVGGTGTVAWVVVADGPVEVQRGRRVLEGPGGREVVVL